MKIRLEVEGSTQEELDRIKSAIAILAGKSTQTIEGLGIDNAAIAKAAEMEVVDEEEVRPEKKAAPKGKKKAPAKTKEPEEENTTPAGTEEEEPAAPAKKEAPTKKSDKTDFAALREEIREILTEKVGGHREDIKKKLSEFDAKNVTRLMDKDLAAFKEYMETL